MSANDDDDVTSLIDQESSVTNLGKREILKRYCKGWWKTVVIVLTPLLLCPVPTVINNTESYAFYSIAIISVYWITEAIPLAATSLLPLVLFPSLGILSADQTAVNYLNDTSMLFVGGLMVAVAIEKWNLHKRLALLVLIIVGSKPKWLLLGFMSVTAFLSMWISNTATAAMMLPIAQAVIKEINESTEETESVTLVTAKYKRSSYNGIKEDREGEEGEEGEGEGEGEEEEEEKGEGKGAESVVLLTTDNDSLQRDKNSDEFSWLAKGLMLGVAYSANIGGIATLTGTGPNLVFKGDIDKLFPEGPGINFGIWFVFACPLMILCLIISWIYLSFIFCNDCFGACKRLLFKSSDRSEYSSTAARRILKQQYKNLGPWKFAEVEVLICFIVLILLWLLREPQFIPGWGSVFKTSDSSNKSYFSDSSTVIFIVLLMFIIPANPCCIVKKRNCMCYHDGSETLLDWKSVHHKLPWNVVLLLGSGFALAEGAEVSGLSCWIGSQLLGIEHLPDVIKSLLVSLIVASVTEVMSNVATTTLFLPILAQLSVALSINPYYLMLPATVSASFAFMLPVATPPNAIAFSYGHIKVYHMACTGILMNLVCIVMVNVAVNTWAVPLFNLHTFPNWTSTEVNSSQCII